MSQPHFSPAAQACEASAHLGVRLGRAWRWLPLAVAMGLALPSLASDQKFEQALASYRSGEVSDAYGRFLALAQRGDPDAARIVLFLSAYGPQLHGKYWELTDRDAAAARTLARRPSRRAAPEFHVSTAQMAPAAR